MACCVSTEAGLSGFCRAWGSFLQKLLRWAGKLLAARLTIAAEFVPVYLGMLVQLGLLSGCGVLCSLTGNARGQELLGCFAEAVRCMMAVTALFAGLAVVGTALLFLVGGG